MRAVRTAWTRSRPRRRAGDDDQTAASSACRTPDLAQQLADPAAGTRSPGAGRPGPAPPAMNPVETRTPTSEPHQRGGAPDRQVVRAGQLRRPSQHPGPVLHPRRRRRGHRRGGRGRAARAALETIWYSVTHGGGDGRTSTTWRRCTPSNGAPRQIRPARLAGPGIAADHLIGVLDQLHGLTRIAGLLARLASRRPPSPSAAAACDRANPPTGACSRSTNPPPAAAPAPRSAPPAPRSCRPEPAPARPALRATTLPARPHEDLIAAAALTRAATRPHPSTTDRSQRRPLPACGC